MKKLYIADPHFFHNNIIQLSHRPYTSLDEMHQDMIKRWNRKVEEEDEVRILGDVSMGHSDEVVKILNQLHGKKYLIVGNHDHKCLKNPRFRACFEEISMYEEVIDGKDRIICFHYPIEEWNGYFRGSLHFFGHVHIKDGNLKQIKGRYNVGADRIGLEPCTKKEILAMYEKGGGK